jgi:hypothetical protein
MRPKAVLYIQDGEVFWNKKATISDIHTAARFLLGKDSVVQFRFVTDEMMEIKDETPGDLPQELC